MDVAAAPAEDRLTRGLGPEWLPAVSVIGTKASQANKTLEGSRTAHTRRVQKTLKARLTLAFLASSLLCQEHPAFPLAIPPHSPSPRMITQQNSRKDPHDSSTDIARLVVGLPVSIACPSHLSIGDARTLAQPRHQLPANPPPFGSSAAAVHDAQFSPMRPMMVMRDILPSTWIVAS
jgi:hypothetical protein